MFSMALIEEEYCLFSNPPAPITCHTWSKDKRKVAVCPGNNQIVVLSRDMKEGTLPAPLPMTTTATHAPIVEKPCSTVSTENFYEILEDHDKMVTCVDWAPDSNRIVSCAQDRNAYVWTPTMEGFKPTLVILRINRSATCVKWSPKENKFAVGSNSRMIAIAYFEQDNDWWVCKHVKKPIRSTILSVDWHPNNAIVACGSTDFRVRIFSVFIKNLDESGGVQSNWGPTGNFGDLIAEFAFEGQGWIHSVSFSPSGDHLAWASHDSAVGVATGSTKRTDVLKLPNLPFLSLLFVNETTFIAAGHDCWPAMFQLDSTGKIKFLGKIDAQPKTTQTISGTAMKMFKQIASRAQFESSDVNLDSLHQNSISCVSAYERSGNEVTKIATSGWDGRLIVWNIANFVSRFANLHI